MMIYTDDDSRREWMSLETDLYQVIKFKKKLKYSVRDRMIIIYMTSYIN